MTGRRPPTLLSPPPPGLDDLDQLFGRHRLVTARAVPAEPKATHEVAAGLAALLAERSQLAAFAKVDGERATRPTGGGTTTRCGRRPVPTAQAFRRQGRPQYLRRPFRTKTIPHIGQMSVVPSSCDGFSLSWSRGLLVGRSAGRRRRSAGGRSSRALSRSGFSRHGHGVSSWVARPVGAGLCRRAIVAPSSRVWILSVSVRGLPGSARLARAGGPAPAGAIVAPSSCDGISSVTGPSFGDAWRAGRRPVGSCPGRLLGR